MLTEIAIRAWLAFKHGTVGNETYRKMKLLVEGDLIPVLRHASITTLATKDCRSCAISPRVPPTSLAAKARQYLNGVVDYAI